MKPTYVFMAVLAMSAASQAGITIKSVDGQGETSTILVDGNRLRIEGKQVLIFDGDKKELITVDPEKRAYSIGTESDMKKMGADVKNQMEGAQVEMRKQMATMPPEQRKQMEEAMKQMGQSGGGKSGRPPKNGAPEKVTYEPLGEKKQVAGQSCDLYRVVRGGHGGTEQTCFIPWSSGTVKKDELKAFDGFAKFMAVLTESMGGSSDEAKGQWSRELRDAPGLPALILGAPGKTKMKLTSIERGPIDADKFSPPAGYRKSSKPMWGE
jgi:Domain of unknown function (DUF4412)